MWVPPVSPNLPYLPPYYQWQLQALVPLEVLYEFDGPRIFSFRDGDGELYLAYWSDEEGELWRYVVVPTTAAIVDSLKAGRLSVWDALNQPRSWLCDTGLNGNVVQMYRVDFELIPADTLPAPSAMLLPSLEPLLSLRAVGETIVAGSVPGSVIRSCVEGVQKSFKFMSEYVLGKDPQRGRPDDFLRRLFDLPAQRFAFRSFEIAFRMPTERMPLFALMGEKSPETETLEEVSNLLVKGLRWLESAAGEEGIYSTENPAESEVLLRALKELTPSSQGPVDRIEVRGQLLGPGKTSLVLTKDHRLRVNSAIRFRSLEPVVSSAVGRVRELDKDRLTFELREINDDSAQSRRYVFDKELLDDVFEALQDDDRVQVTASTFHKRNVAYAIAITPMSKQRSGDAATE